MDKQTEKAIRAIIERISRIESQVYANTGCGLAWPRISDIEDVKKDLTKACGLQPENEDNNESK